MGDVTTPPSAVDLDAIRARHVTDSGAIARSWSYVDWRRCGESAHADRGALLAHLATVEAALVAARDAGAVDIQRMHGHLDEVGAPHGGCAFERVSALAAERDDAKAALVARTEERDAEKARADAAHRTLARLRKRLDLADDQSIEDAIEALVDASDEVGCSECPAHDAAATFAEERCREQKKRADAAEARWSAGVARVEAVVAERIAQARQPGDPYPWDGKREWTVDQRVMLKMGAEMALTALTADAPAAACTPAEAAVDLAAASGLSVEQAADVVARVSAPTPAAPPPDAVHIHESAGSALLSAIAQPSPLERLAAVSGGDVPAATVETLARELFHTYNAVDPIWFDEEDESRPVPWEDVDKQARKAFVACAVRGVGWMRHSLTSEAAVRAADIAYVDRHMRAALAAACDAVGVGAEPDRFAPGIDWLSTLRTILRTPPGRAIDHHAGEVRALADKVASLEQSSATAVMLQQAAEAALADERAKREAAERERDAVKSDRDRVASERDAERVPRVRAEARLREVHATLVQLDQADSSRVAPGWTDEECILLAKALAQCETDALPVAEAAIDGTCPTCRKPREAAADDDPRCSSCVEAGEDHPSVPQRFRTMTREEFAARVADIDTTELEAALNCGRKDAQAAMRSGALMGRGPRVEPNPAPPCPVDEERRRQARERIAEYHGIVDPCPVDADTLERWRNEEVPTGVHGRVQLVHHRRVAVALAWLVDRMQAAERAGRV